MYAPRIRRLVRALLPLLTTALIGAAPASAAELLIEYPLDLHPSSASPLPGTLHNGAVGTLQALDLTNVGGFSLQVGGNGDFLIHNAPQSPDPNRYFRFGAQANPGYGIELSAIRLSAMTELYNNADGPRVFTLQGSTDGFATECSVAQWHHFGSPKNVEIPQMLTDFSCLEQLDGCNTSLEFRLYVWHTGNASHGGGLLNSGNYAGDGINPRLEGLVGPCAEAPAGPNPPQVCLAGFPDGTAGMCFAFDEVTEPGRLLARRGTLAELLLDPGQIDFVVPTSSPNFWDIEFSGTFAGDVEITFFYSDTLLSPSDEASLQIYHLDGAAWEVLPRVELNTNDNYIRVLTNGFSPFGLGQPTSTSTSTSTTSTTSTTLPPASLASGRSIAIRAGRYAKLAVRPAPADAFPLPLDDVTTIGGSLRILDMAGTGGDDTYALPGAGWKGLGTPAGSKGWKYRGAGTPGDPCKLVLLKSTSAKAVCSGAGMTLTPPFGGGVGVELTVGGTGRYCAQLGGDETRNDDVMTKRKNAPPPDACL